MALTRRNDPGPRKRFRDNGARKTKEQRLRETREAAAAYDAMFLSRTRPITPPPMPAQRDTRTAGQLALAQDIRKGAYKP